MSNEKDAKLKALQLTLDKLDKAYGKGAVMKMGDRSKIKGLITSLLGKILCLMNVEAKPFQKT